MPGEIERLLFEAYAGDAGEHLGRLLRAARLMGHWSEVEIGVTLGLQRRIVRQLERRPFDLPWGVVIGYGVALGLGPSELVTPTLGVARLLSGAASSGIWLLGLRAWAGLSRDAAADQLAVTRQTMVRWEQGLIPVPRLTEIAERLDPLGQVTGQLGEHMIRWGVG